MGGGAARVEVSGSRRSILAHEEHNRPTEGDRSMDVENELRVQRSEEQTDSINPLAMRAVPMAENHCCVSALELAANLHAWHSSNS